MMNLHFKPKLPPAARAAAVAALPRPPQVIHQFVCDCHHSRLIRSNTSKRYLFLSSSIMFYHVLSFACFWSCGLESFERSCKHQALHKAQAALLRPIATQLGTTHLRYPSLWDLEEAPKHPRASPGRSSFAFGWMCDGHAIIEAIVAKWSGREHYKTGREEMWWSLNPCWT